MNSRDAILSKLRRCNQSLPEASALLDYAVMAEKQWSETERVERFISCMTSVKGEVHLSSSDDWCDLLAKILAEKSVRNLLLSKDTEAGEQIYAGAGMPELMAYDQPIESWKEELFQYVDASFTITLGGIAETGSLVLWTSVNEPRLMSIVPPVHVALLDKKNIYSTFYQCMKRQQWVEKGLPGNVLLISGPSKTADIEQTLAYGVHGPKELVVIII